MHCPQYANILVVHKMWQAGVASLQAVVCERGYCHAHTCLFRTWPVTKVDPENVVTYTQAPCRSICPDRGRVTIAKRVQALQRPLKPHRPAKQGIVLVQPFWLVGSDGGCGAAFLHQHSGIWRRRILDHETISADCNRCAMRVHCCTASAANDSYRTTPQAHVCCVESVGSKVEGGRVSPFWGKPHAASVGKSRAPADQQQLSSKLDLLLRVKPWITAPSSSHQHTTLYFRKALHSNAHQRTSSHNTFTMVRRTPRLRRTRPMESPFPASSTNTSQDETTLHHAHQLTSLPP